MRKKPVLQQPTHINRFVMQRRSVIARDALMDGLLRGMSESSYFVGKSIILFTMFYCSMNWWHYKSLRQELEDAKDKEKEKDNKNKK